MVAWCQPRLGIQQAFVTNWAIIGGRSWWRQILYIIRNLKWKWWFKSNNTYDESVRVNFEGQLSFWDFVRYIFIIHGDVRPNGLAEFEFSCWRQTHRCAGVPRIVCGFDPSHLRHSDAFPWDAIGNTWSACLFRAEVLLGMMLEQNRHWRCIDGHHRLKKRPLQIQFEFLPPTCQSKQHSGYQWTVKRTFCWSKARNGRFPCDIHGHILCIGSTSLAQRKIWPLWENRHTHTEILKQS